MKTNPTVSRFADRAKITVQPNTRIKADEEASSYEFTVISRGHYACTNGDTIHIIIERNGTIGCSCSDMTYRRRDNDVCKHIAAFLDLDVPPQIPAPGELIQNLLVMGWTGGKDDLHPAELLRRPSGNPETDELIMVHYECPKCGECVDVPALELRDWKLSHLDVCKGTKPPVQEPVIKKSLTTEKQTVKKTPDLPPDEDSWKPDGEDDMDCLVTESPAIILPDGPTSVPPNLATALCNMQMTELSAVADSNNPFHNAKYADLSSVWAAIRKPLTSNGLAILQTTQPYPRGITVITTLMHISGESVSTSISAEVAASKPDKNGQVKPNIQGLGSTITYLRRYSLAAMVGVASVDDDGESAMGR